jgi:tartrate-resistant acid phosphatase type 5
VTNRPRTVALGAATALVVASLAAVLVVPGAAAPTAAPAGDAPRRAVAVIGDFGAGSDGERSVADLVARARPVAVVTTGDNVYGDRGYAALVGDYYGPWVAARNLLPAVGNHDHEEGITAFDAYFGYLGGRHVYAAGRGGMRFFVIDSTTALESSDALARQRGWLERSLRASKARWNVVVLHHPPYSSSSVHGSTASLQWPFGAWGADLVLSGHDHDYERIQARGTTYVVSGAGGKDLYPFGRAVPGSAARDDADFGALFLTAGPAALTGEFWSVAGTRIDRFVISDR